LKKKYVTHIIAMIPFIFIFCYQYILKININELLEDNRTVKNAIPLETIHGKKVGKAIKKVSLQGVIEYIVKPNDGWWKIAKHFKVKDHYQLKNYNRNKKLYPGVKIKIPYEMINNE